MRKRIGSLLLLTLFFSLMSCKNNRRQLEKMVDSFAKETICMPSGMVEVYDGEKRSAEIKSGLPKMVYWFDSTECSMCNAKRLGYMDRLYAKSLEYGPFEIMLVFSPPVNEATTTLETLSLYDLAHPIILDPGQLFIKANPWMEEYPFFHRFFVDEHGHPLFVGDPLSSDAMWAVFEKIIKQEH